MKEHDRNNVARDTFYGAGNSSWRQRPSAPVKKNLLVICHGFPPYYGGAEHVAYHLAIAAVKTRRYQVTVLTSDIGGRLAGSEDMDGVKVVRISARKKNWTYHNVFELFSFLRSANRHMKKLLITHHPDHILAHFSLPAGAVARNIWLTCNFPYSVVLHGSDVPGYQNHRFGLLYPLTRKWIRSVWKNAAHVIAVSHSLKQLALASWPNGSIDAIPNGVDFSRFQSLGKRARQVSSDWKNVVVIAQLIERKGIQHLLSALSRMQTSDLGNMRLNIYGTGPYESRLKSMTRELKLDTWVTFHGLAPYESIPDILADADLFVLPTLQEAMPLTLMEAMASGCPIISTDAGGIPSIVENGKEGLLVPIANAEKLKDAVLELLNSPDRAKQLGAAAKERARSFDWSVVWQQYEQLIFSPVKS